MSSDSTFFTIGHSTRSVEEFVALLRDAGANFVVDVRSIPRSRTNPQFNGDSFPDVLSAFQIGYSHLKRLGGLRGHVRNSAPSRNTFWENTSFRNYADYAATPDFREGMVELYALDRTHVCAIMCAEAGWWRCHRRIIADYLIAEGHEVFHIMGPGKVDPVSINPAAVRELDGVLLYPGGGEQGESS